MQLFTMPRRGVVRAGLTMAVAALCCVGAGFGLTRTSASASQGGASASIPTSLQRQLTQLKTGEQHLRRETKKLFAAQRTAAHAQREATSAQSKLSYAEQIDAAKQSITQQQSLYGLLFNGDGPQGPNRVLWGKQIFTGEGPFLAYDANDQLIPSQSFQHMKDEIADAVATQPSTWPDTSNPDGSMHYMFAPVFRHINLKTAVTDTPSMSVNATKGTQTVNTLTIRVYHDVWKNTKNGWRKTASTWYRLD
jgi:hypothetical protein